MLRPGTWAMPSAAPQPATKSPTTAQAQAAYLGHAADSAANGDPVWSHTRHCGCRQRKSPPPVKRLLVV